MNKVWFHVIGNRVVFSFEYIFTALWNSAHTEELKSLMEARHEVWAFNLNAGGQRQVDLCVLAANLVFT